MTFIFGLGNPGSEYKETRHNVGFMTVDRIAALKGLKLRKRCFYPYKIAYFCDKETGLVEPLTYMNNSGLAITSLLKEGDRLIVICDQMDLPVGKIRIKKKGGSAGHNGLKSIISAWSEDFIHVYVGIDHPKEGESVADYVLSSFSDEEKIKLNEALDFLAPKILEIIEGKEIDEIIRDVNSFTL